MKRIVGAWKCHKMTNNENISHFEYGIFTTRFKCRQIIAAISILNMVSVEYNTKTN